MGGPWRMHYGGVIIEELARRQPEEGNQEEPARGQGAEEDDCRDMLPAVKSEIRGVGPPRDQ